MNLYAKDVTVVTTYKWEPFNMIINGKIEGIGIDFWKLVAKKVGIDYKIKIVKRWPEVLDHIKTCPSVLTVGTDMTPERSKYAYFSKPYVIYPLVIATKNDVGFIFDIQYLKNKKIALGRHYTAAKMMKEKYPGLDYVYTENIDEALKLVRESKVFAAVDILPVIAYKINKYEFKNLKISGEVPLMFKVRFMLSKHLKDLLPEINKAIDSITYFEKEKIYHKYIKPAKKVSFTAREMILYFLLFVSFLIIIALWFYTLHNEMKIIKKNKIKECSNSYDRLTGVFNKQKAKELIDECSNAKEKCAVCMFDIKNFREINRFYGHQFGDIALLELVSLIKSQLKKDEYLARIGGGSFIIILNETEIEACKRANEIYQSIENFEFSIVKDLKCTFAVKTFYDKNSEKILNELKKEIIKNKRKNRLFSC